MREIINRKIERLQKIMEWAEEDADDERAQYCWINEEYKTGRPKCWYCGGPMDCIGRMERTNGNGRKLKYTIWEEIERCRSSSCRHIADTLNMPEDQHYWNMRRAKQWIRSNPGALNRAMLGNDVPQEIRVQLGLAIILKEKANEQIRQERKSRTQGRADQADQRRAEGCAL